MLSELQKTTNILAKKPGSGESSPVPPVPARRVVTEEATPSAQDLSLSLATLSVGKSLSFQNANIVYIRSRMNGSFLTAKGTTEGSQVVAWEFKGNQAQQWYLQEGFIVNVYSQMALDIDEGLLGKNLVVRAYKGKLRQSQQFDIDQENGFITSRDKRYPNLCFDIRGQNKSNGASIILYSKHGSSNQLFDVIMKQDREVRNLDEFQSTKKMGGYNVSQKLQLGAETVFFKPHKCERTILLEVGGSELTNYITGGLVPLSTRASFHGVLGIAQPFVKIDDSMFKKNLKLLNNYVADLTFLNKKQAHQLFIHVIADRLISNWDTHNEQFAIDEEGNLISFDKEKCFYLFVMSNMDMLNKLNISEDYRRLHLNVNLWKNPSLLATHNLYFINSSLVQLIQNGTIKIDPQDKIIQDMFERCEKIDKELVAKCFGDYALIKYYSKAAEEFIDIIYQRIRNIRKAVYHYFKWEQYSDNHAGPWILE